MKLRNKKTGQTGYYLHTHRDHKDGHIKVAVLKDDVPFSEFKPYEPIYDYDSLAELNEEWEDVPEEPKSKYLYVIDPTRVNFINDVYKEDEPDWCEQALELGIGFETKEEAEKAAEKLKAWKRLKDKGFRFTGFTHKDRGRMDELEIYCQLGECPEDIEDMEDARLLFGGEE